MTKRAKDNLQIKSFYTTIANPVKSELGIIDSRFIANALPVNSIKEAHIFLKEIRKNYHDATHNCFAFRIETENNYFRFNDDGEPPGTAGKPIFNAILHFGLTNLLVVVTRYFGGTKLGTSGLINAYFTSAKKVLLEAEFVKIPITTTLHLQLDYTLYPKIQQLLYTYTKKIEEIFSKEVEIFAQVPIDLIDLLKEKINYIGNGKILTEFINKQKDLNENSQ